MEDAEGEKHVELGAKIMGAIGGQEWHDLCLYHSRFYAKRDNAKYSKLCVADKLCIVLTPAWLYIPMTRATGEIKEYMAMSRVRAQAGESNLCGSKVLTEAEWYKNIQKYIRRWVLMHKDLKEDTWTPVT
jgi:hypothetical protein